VCVCVCVCMCVCVCVVHCSIYKQVVSEAFIKPLFFFGISGVETPNCVTREIVSEKSCLRNICFECGKKWLCWDIDGLRC
jgi:hypothetical protein